MRIYLAAPFFNPGQLEVVKKLEDLLADTSHKFHSPRKTGVLIDMEPEKKKLSTRTIFNDNVAKLEWCHLVLAVVDGRDVGTMWELGYAYRARKHIATYTELGFGLNVMIQESVSAHLKGIEAASRFLFKLESDNVESASVEFRNFHPDVT